MFIALSCLHHSPPIPPSPPPLLPLILSSCLSFSPFLADRSDIRNLYYQVFPGCWWKSWFATPDWIYLSFIPFQPPTSCPSRQEPNSLSIPRSQGKNIFICRRRGREEETWRGKKVRGIECRPTCHGFGQPGAGREGYICSLWFSPIPTRTPSPLKTFIYKHYTAIYQQQTKHVTPPKYHHLCTHMHVGQRRCPDEGSQRESIKAR